MAAAWGTRGAATSASGGETVNVSRRRVVDQRLSWLKRQNVTLGRDIEDSKATSGSGRMRVLVIEDEQHLAAAIARGLRRQGMAVDVENDGLTGHEAATTTRYDVVVLDRDLPSLHGDRVCADLVRRGLLTRVLMLTASGSVADRVDGLNLGADDYLAKPFDFGELVARVQALGRRSTPAAPPVLHAADVEVDPSAHRAERGGRKLDLTNKEFGLLVELIKADGALVSTEELLDRVWDSNADPFTSTVRVTMRTLRRKLGEPQLIENVPKEGYRVVDLGADRTDEG